MHGERRGRRGHGNEEESKKLVPPDGGWGWMVVLGFAVNNLVMVPLITGMGLIFKDLFRDLHFPQRDASIIMSMNMSFGMFMGLTHGPLLKIFGYRKIALAGSIMYVSGLMMTAISHKFTHFMVSHGFITSLGVSLAMAAFSLAINTYFIEKRGLAMGLAMTITAIGPIIMPQIITVLSDTYPTQHAIFILGAIGLHTVVASLLLQPIKWHSKRPGAKPKDNNDIEQLIANIKNLKPDSVITDTFQRKRTISVSSLDGDPRNHDLQSLEIKEETTKTQVICVRRDSISTQCDGKPGIRHFKSLQNVQSSQPDESRARHHSRKWCSTGRDLDITNFGSCPMLLDGPLIYHVKSSSTLQDHEGHEVITKENNDKNNDANNTSVNGVPTAKHLASGSSPRSVKNGGQDMVQSSKKERQKSSGGSCLWLSGIVRFFDLSLLCDPIYLNIMFGMAIATFAEINFTILLPFILEDVKFTTSQSATVMTTTAAVDLLMRALAPFVGERMRQTPRVIYLASLTMLILSRSILLYKSSFTAMMLMAIGIGFAKGFRSVFMLLIVPNYIPIERLADAAGLQMVVNGLVLMILGPIIGIIREWRGSYDLCIVLINGMTLLTIMMWTLEFFLTRLFKNDRKRKEQYQPVAVAK